MIHFKPSLSPTRKQPNIEQQLQQATAYIEQRLYAEAETLARDMIRHAPELDVAYQILGLSLSEQNIPEKYQEAVEACKKAVSLSPNNSGFLNLLGNALSKIKSCHTEAEAAYKKAMTLDPGSLDPLYNLSKLYITMGRMTEAEAGFQEALVKSPQQPEIYHNLGICAYNQEAHQQAILWFKLALHLTADSYRKGELTYHIGLCHEKMNRYRDAIEWFEKTLDFNPHAFDALIHICFSLYYTNQFKPAEMYVKAYLQHSPEENRDTLNAKMLLCGILKATGNNLGAIEIYKEIVDEFPRAHEAFSNMLLDMVYSDEITQDEMFSWCKKYADRYEKPYIDSWPKHKNTPDPERKLRIGYVSADFFNHSVSYFALPLITRHDKNKFEVITYAVRNMPGLVSDQYKKETRWTPLHGMNPNDFFNKIIEDEIDILIDLSGHTGGNQLGVLARKPAPIQVTWLGYPFSTGLKSMDYRIVDEIVEPKGTTEHLNTERLVRIPGMFCAYRPSIGAPERLLNGDLDIQTTPAKANGYVTFGCCNNIAKVTDYTLQLWARVLEAVPTAKLLIETGDVESEFTQEKLHARFANNGVPVDRVILSDRAKNRQYSLYHQIDIALDPYPCNGGTTTCDALFMSVPVVSLSGVRFMSRIGATALTNIGHPEWVTDSPDEYVNIAVNLAADIEQLDHIRQKLRGEVENSPLMDEVGFTRKVERAYREMWRAWCAAQQGQHYEPDLDGASTAHAQSHDEIVETVQAQTNWPQLEALQQAADWEGLSQHVMALLDQQPENPELNYFGGVAYQKLGDVDTALAMLEKAHGQAPDNDVISLQLAQTYLAAGHEAQAESVLRQLSQSSHGLSATGLLASNMLADLLVAQGKRQSLASEDTNQKFNEAISLLQHVLEYRPQQLESWITLAKLQAYRNRHTESEVAVRRVLKLDAQHYEANVLLARMVMSRFHFEQAEKILNQLLEAYPEDPRIDAELALSELYANRGWIERASELDHLMVQKQPTSLQAWQLLFCHLEAAPVDPQQHRDLQSRFLKALGVNAQTTHLNPPDASRKLRLGVLGGDLRGDFCATLCLPVLEMLNTSQFEVMVYFNGEVFDRTSQRLRHVVGADNWRFTRGLTQEMMIGLIQQDEIDVLIDLDGHGPHNQLPTLAAHPAPVQIKWLGNTASTGVENIGYWLTDKTQASEASDLSRVTEAPLHMIEHAYCVYRPFADHPEWHSMPAFAVQEAPSVAKGYLTFGSLASNQGLTRATLALWSRTLHAVEHARLVLSNQEILATVREFMVEQGIDPERVYVTQTHLDTPLRLCHEIDIALDTIPANECLSTLHTLWMGVPIVTLVGTLPAQRITASLLNQLGHEEWVANDEAQFLDIVRTLAGQPIAERNAQRHALRDQMRQSPLLDEVGFTREFEAKIRSVWQAWCNSPAADAAKDHQNQREALQLCSMLMQQGDYAQAWNGYKSILTQWPQCAEALYGLGLNALLSGQPQQAEQLLSRALSMMMQTGHFLQADCLATLGQTYLSMEKPEHALACWQNALSLQDSEQVRTWVSELTGALH